MPLARLAGIPAILQIDRLDSERAKWSGAARAYLRAAERIAPAAASLAMTDSRAVADAYEERYGRRIAWIPYGAELADPGDAGWCRRLGVEPGRFVLFVGRLEPENNAHLLVEAHRRIAFEWPLVVVGDAPYAAGYIAALHAAGGEGVRFPGYVFGDGYAELVHRCGVMCVPTEVGGTHPVIVEGMAAGAAMLVSDHPPNVETVGDGAATFALAGGAAALADALGSLIEDGARRADLGRRAAERTRERYSWHACAGAYIRLIEAVLSRRGGRGPGTACPAPRQSGGVRR